MRQETEIYHSNHARAVLTTDHAASSYGVPVLVTLGAAYGPADILPSVITAGALVRAFIDNQDPGCGSWGERTDEVLDLARRFLGVRYGG